jgi:hypothetical protein
MVNSITQSFSYSAVRLNVAVSTAAPAKAPASATAPADTVTLSPAATTASNASPSTDASPGTTGATPPVPPVSPVERRAEALFDVLDADDDGAVTEEEFTEGALQLLRNAGARRRVQEGEDRGRHEGHGRHEDHGRHEGRGLGRLERRLEKLFDRVDANDDGALDRNELTDALARVGARRTAAPAPSTAEPAQASGTFVAVSVTYVSIAVQRYTALQGATPAGTPGPGAPDATTAPESAAPGPDLAAA